MKDKIQKATTEECKRHEYKQNSQYLWNIIILLQKKHWSFSEACLQMNTTILIKLTKRNIQLNKINLFFLSLEPHDHQIYNVNIDLHHQYAISVCE